MSKEDAQKALRWFNSLLKEFFPKNVSDDCLEIRAIRVALQAQINPLQPIATAPKDGTPILIAVPSNSGRIVHYVSWNRQGKWVVFDSGQGHRAYVDATHWMPLPLPPEETK